MPVKIALYLLTLISILNHTLANESDIDEHEAVIEFDLSDDLFMQLTSHDSTVVHLYRRQDN